MGKQPLNKQEMSKEVIEGQALGSVDGWDRDPEKLKLRDSSNDFHNAICSYTEERGFDAFSKSIVRGKIEFLLFLAAENGIELDYGRLKY